MAAESLRRPLSDWVNFAAVAKWRKSERRSRIPKALVAVAGGASLFAVPMIAASSASACPTGHSSDPFTGQCYVNGALPTVNGIPCIPGQSMGTCLGFLQNKPLPGGAPPGGPWP